MNESARDSDDVGLQVEEVDRIDLANKLQELSEQLQRAAALLYNRDRADELDERAMHGADPDEFEQEKIGGQSRDEFRRALTALRDFRRQYSYWERVIAEYTLGPMGYTQRDAARYLGVGVSTINRWAQHPLAVEEHR